MPLSLPARPSWEQLQNQAKDLIKAHRDGNPTCCGVLRRLRQFQARTDAEILHGSLSLVEAQYALAMEYGFPSWEQLKRHVAGVVSATGRHLDYSEVRLVGNGWEMDTFCLSLQEALRILGKVESYETLLASTLNAFAPGFDTGNDCKELWVCQGWISHIGPLHIAWNRLGVSVESISFETQESSTSAQDPQQARRAAAARGIRQALEAGCVVVVSGGWKSGMEPPIEPWWAGIVTEVREDGSVLGAHLNGRNDNEIADVWPGEAFAVRLTRPRDDAEKVSGAIFQAAVNRIRARGEHFARKKFSAFGVDAMDEWIGQMEATPHFCPACHKNNKAGWQSAAKVARATVHRSDIAARFLRSEMTLYSRAAASCLNEAALQYEQICNLLAPAVSDRGGAGYREFIGDIEKQKAHAASVLKPVRGALLAAAEQLENAVALMT